MFILRRTYADRMIERGYDLTFRAPRDLTPRVIEDDVPSFAHVVLFAPETKSMPTHIIEVFVADFASSGYAPDITPQSLVTLLQGKTNLLLALGPKQTPLTSLASEFSLILPPPGTPLISHFPKRDTPASVIPIDLPSHPILTPGTPPIWFSGISHALGNNPLLFPIVHAPAESFAADSTEDLSADTLADAADKGGEGLWAGSSMAIVSGFQTKTGARATWVGGVELFSDAFARKELSK
jgi:oligosaccharyltransferase complex subunit beta